VSQQTTTAIENNFTKGFVTESTGLNFPENAATDTDNCEYTLIGDVNRRLGIDLEENFFINTFADITNKAVSTYKWNNVGGDGLTQLVVVQNGSKLTFFSVTHTTTTFPLSACKIGGTIELQNFISAVGSFDFSLECQYADGNGYLFVFHPNCDPIYVSHLNGVVTGVRINVQIRDFEGVNDSLIVNTRPTSLSNAHLYNLSNQGWTQGAAWAAHQAAVDILAVGSHTFTVESGITGTSPGDAVSITAYNIFGNFVGVLASGTMTAYAGTSMTVNILTTVSAGTPFNTFTITPTNHGYISTWNSAIGNYPSDADVWWTFKNASDVFDPTTQINNTTLNTGYAPKGHFIINAFNQQRSLVSAISSIDDIYTTKRPKTGTWFQGRVWYTGLDASQPVTGVANAYTWTENIYFSQIVTNSPTNFGNCYQVNDPTSDALFDLLPTDGGVITIQGSGSIYKLFPLQNALLVFAANGVWYITGSQGIGFSANDYTIVKLSSVQSISSTSFVNVNGLPLFWNEDGIYKVAPAQQGGGIQGSPLHVNPLEVTPVTIGTIATFYNQIPLSSKKYARGDYHPINYVVQWVYKDTEATSIADRYTFNKIMNFNTVNNAFFPYTAANDNISINGINYVAGPGGTTSPPPAFKYLTFIAPGISFAEEYRTDYTDWVNANLPSNYTSYFVTGFKLRGQAIKKFQPQYIQVYSRTNGEASAYKIQGIWNFANDPSSGKYSTAQLVTNGLTRFETVFRRHKIRGSGYVLQFKISSVDTQPFDIQGWAVVDTVNAGT